jgi:hypothetical protein
MWVILKPSVVSRTLMILRTGGYAQKILWAAFLRGCLAEKLLKVVETCLAGCIDLSRQVDGYRRLTRFLRA